MNEKQFVFFRKFKDQALFDDLCCLIKSQGQERLQIMPDPLDCVSRLLELAVTHGFQGNLWHCFLVLIMISHENPYTLSCERREQIDDDLYQLAQLDFGQIKQLYDFDLTTLDKPEDETKIWSLISHYQATNIDDKLFHRQVRRRMLAVVEALGQAQDGAAFQKIMTTFYQQYGVGKFGLNQAFRINESIAKVGLDPIKNVEQTCFSSIVGYELQKQKLIANTESFIRGKAANNVLLYGDAGTGKSSSIKAVLNEYYDQGLRMIEIYKHQFQSLTSILEQIEDRNYKFIIYMDDLSFEDHELEYKYLKAIIEGGLGKKPDHVLIYATSNRRHLIREKFSDKKSLDDELHGNDTVQEKLSLAARFGVTIYYGAPDKTEFEEIVEALANQHKLNISKDELLAAANQWELSHGGRSGRTAAQFITHILGIK